MMLGSLSVNGEQPPLVGLACEELLAAEYWHAGELVEPANVIYLRFGGAWHRLYFDCGIVFWRLYDRAPEGVSPGEKGFGCPLVDLGQRFGVQGVVVDRLAAAPIEGGSEVRFVFRNGMVVLFSCVADTTTYRAEISPGMSSSTTRAR
jgi:hypothetical protein